MTGQLLAYNPSDVKPGWIAFWIVVAMGVATFLLWRSMNKQLRKIQMPPKQDRPRPGPGRAPIVPPADGRVPPPHDDDPVA
jgi:hypothetical protein